METTPKIWMLPANGLSTLTRTPFRNRFQRPNIPWQVDQGVKRRTSMYFKLPISDLLLIVSRTSSKATTVWPMSALQRHIPKVLLPELRSCRLYVRSSDTIQIQCDSHRNRSENKSETHRRLNEEMKK